MAKTRSSKIQQKIDRSTLPAIIAEQLGEMIIEGIIEAGSKLNERELCEHLGVSRTPLREAFRLLASDGLIDIEPNRGARIPILSETDIRESFAILGVLEALSGELACQHATDEEIAQIQSLTDQMKASYAEHDLPTYYHLNRKIHSRINDAARNSLLEQVYTRLNRRIQNLRFQSNLNRNKWERAMQEHLAMIDALSRRDEVELSRLMRAHMQRKCEAIISEHSTRQPRPGL